MEKKYILISMEDSGAKKLSKVLGNAACKKIIDLLAEKELSEKDIADALKTPINTVEYNLNKLMQAELIEKAKNFFWSKKGKKIDIYRLSNKSIIISPRSSRISSKIKSILPVALLSGIGTILIKSIFESQQKAQTLLRAPDSAITEISQIIAGKNDYLIIQSPANWVWFLVGALFVLLIFAILNWRKL